MVYRLDEQGYKDAVRAGNITDRHFLSRTLRKHKLILDGRKCVYFADEGNGLWSKLFYNPRSHGDRWIWIRLNVMNLDANFPNRRNVVSIKGGKTFDEAVANMDAFVYACLTDGDVASMMVEIGVDIINHRRSRNVGS